MTAGASRAATTITRQPALAPSPQPRPAPTARALASKTVARRGQHWTPIRGQSWKPIDTGLRRYLVAGPPKAADAEPKTYRLDNISNVKIVEAYFVRPEGFDLQAFANRAFGVFQNEAEFGEVVWRFSPKAAEQARGHIFHPDQAVEDESDGSMVVKFHAAGYLEMCWYLYAWGDNVEVVKPKQLKKMTEKHRRTDFPVMP